MTGLFQVSRTRANIKKILVNSGHLLSHYNGDPCDDLGILLPGFAAFRIFRINQKRPVAVTDEDDIRSRVEQPEQDHRVFVKIADALKRNGQSSLSTEGKSSNLKLIDKMVD